MPTAEPCPPRRVAVVGSGIAGMACAWLLARGGQAVTLFEADDRAGGHSHTVDVTTPEGPVAVDTGFIVYNGHTYPNLCALFDHLRVPTAETDMSFAVSIDGGALEYAGSRSGGLFAQRRNLLRPRFWAMLRDLVRFYREAPRLLDDPAAESLTLGEYLTREGYGRPFVDDHLLPMGAAIWSAAPDDVRRHPAMAFVRFCHNHGLLKLRDRPRWRTVAGGSREYVGRLLAPLGPGLRTGTPVSAVRRCDGGGVKVLLTDGTVEVFDALVLACHADQAFALLADAGPAERSILGTFRTQPNEAWLHTDPGLMPVRRAAWASWNHLARRDVTGQASVCVTYWMNRLQPLATRTDLFVTLNPERPPRPEAVLRRIAYSHPLFDAETLRAQRMLWKRQGRRDTWFCGAWLGNGFHEDGLQTGLAVAEALGGARRPWSLPDQNDRLPGPPLADRRPARDAGVPA